MLKEMKEAVKMKIRGKYRLFITICIFLILISALFAFQYKRTVIQLQNSDSPVSVMKKTDKIIKLSNGNNVITQSFKCEKKKISGIELVYGTYGQKIDGYMNVKIFEKENPSNSMEVQNIDLKDVIDNVPFPITFNLPFERGPGKDIEISIEIVFKNDSLSLYAGSPISEDEVMSTEVNGENSNKNIYFSLISGNNSFVKNVYIMLFLFVQLLVVIAFVLLFVKKIPIEKAFLFIVLFIGIVYMFLIPANKVPDEYAHYQTAYSRSNAIMQIEKSERKSGADREANLIYKNSSIEKAKYAYYNFNDREKPKEKDEKVSALNVPLYMHFPAAIGITIGRLLGAGNVSVFYLGRFVNLLFFSCCAYFAVKKLPIGKMTLITVCLFPMTLQLAASYSYDAVINGLSILFVSYCIFYIYEKDKIVFKDVILLLILGALLTACKTGAYAPLCFLVFLIPKEKFQTNRRWLLSLSGIILGYVSWFCIQSLSAMTKVASANENYIEWAGEPGYTMPMLLENPLHFVFIMANTVWEKVDFWMDGIVGKALGWFDIVTFSTIVMGFVIITLITLVKTRQETFTLKVSHRILIVFLSLISGGMIIVAMLTGWTPVSYLYVEGVQGRYFLPLILGLLLCIKNKNIVMINNIDRQLLMGTLLLQSVTVCHLFESVFR